MSFNLFNNPIKKGLTGVKENDNVIFILFLHTNAYKHMYSR